MILADLAFIIVTPIHRSGRSRATGNSKEDFERTSRTLLCSTDGTCHFTLMSNSELYFYPLKGEDSHFKIKYIQ